MSGGRAIRTAFRLFALPTVAALAVGVASLWKCIRLGNCSNVSCGQLTLYWPETWDNTLLGRGLVQYLPLGNRLSWALEPPRGPLWIAQFGFGFMMRIPMWLVAAAFASITALLWWRVPRHFTPGGCKECGYDLAGNVSGVCPKCGADAQ